MGKYKERVTYRHYKVTQLRKSFSMSRNMFARELGTTSSQVKLWELNEVVPSIKKVMQMCNRFDVEPNYFFRA